MSFSTIISCAELSGHLNNTDWRIFDCRHQLSDTGYGERAYAESHLPGAFFMHLDRDLSGPMTGHNGRHPLPDPQQLADRLSAAGVSDKTQVVVYDDAGGMIAVRLWWLLRWLGHERVALLDGGINQWIKEGRPQNKDVPVSASVGLSFELRDWIVTADEVLGAGNAAVSRGRDWIAGRPFDSA